MEKCMCLYCDIFCSVRHTLSVCVFSVVSNTLNFLHYPCRPLLYSSTTYMKIIYVLYPLQNCHTYYIYYCTTGNFNGMEVNWQIYQHWSIKINVWELQNHKGYWKCYSRIKRLFATISFIKFPIEWNQPSLKI